MELNLKYYKGSDSYCDGNIEKEIIEYEEKYDSNSEIILEKDMRWPIFYHLTSVRENIINWYPFKKDAEILEIGGGMGAITGILCDKAKNVTTVELSKQRATSILNRNKNRKNLEIIVGNLNEIEFNKKFDYITLIGVFEYAMSFTDTKNPYVDFLKNIKKLLKEDGKLIIAIENKYGMKYFAGAVEDHTNKIYDGITGYEGVNSVRTFGKEEIKEILKNSGFTYTNFYYPLPDYKLPSVIYSDKNLPKSNEEFDYLNYYYENTILNFDEKKAYKETIKNKCFDMFANSFFIEASTYNMEYIVTYAKFNNKLKGKNKLVKIIEKGRMIEKNNEKSKNNDKSAIKFFEKEYKIKGNILELYEEINNLKKENQILKEKVETFNNRKSFLSKIFTKK